MASRQPVTIRRRIVKELSLLPRVECPELDELSGLAAELLRVGGGPIPKPYEQGQKLAVWLREKLGFSNDEWLDPASLLGMLGIPVEEVDLGTDEIDALAAWGPRQGPGVIVNTTGLHSQSSPGRRATLAHEICHLLADREGSLPLAEVLGGQVPSAVEQRANAFAAELLLPQAVAAERIARAGDRDRALDRLVSDFGASREVVGWQVRNGPAWSFLDPSQRKRVTAWTRPWRSDTPWSKRSFQDS